MASIKSYFTALCEKYKDNIAFTVSEKGGDKNISFSELYDSVSALSSALSGYAHHRDGQKLVLLGAFRARRSLCRRSLSPGRPVASGLGILPHRPSERS